MRKLIAGSLMLASTIGCAAAQTSVFYAERGHWTVGNSSTYCYALNRPSAEFNFAPYNALQILVERGYRIGVRVSYWPGAFLVDRDYELMLTFDHAEPIMLPAKPLGDFVLGAEPGQNRDLWKQLQTADQLIVGVAGETGRSLLFVLDDPAWLSKALRDCIAILPEA